MSSETVGGLSTLWTVGRGSRWGWQRSAARWRSDDGTLGGDYAIGRWVLGLPMSHLPTGLARPLVLPAERQAKRLFKRPERHHVGNLLKLGEAHRLAAALLRPRARSVPLPPLISLLSEPSPCLILRAPAAKSALGLPPRDRLRRPVRSARRASATHLGTRSHRALLLCPPVAADVGG